MVPLFLRMRIRKSSQKRAFTLFFPVFLVWIILAALLLVLFPFVLLAALAVRPRGWSMSVLRMVALPFSLLWNLSGLYIQVVDPPKELLIYFK